VRTVRIPVAEVFEPLLKPARYRIAWGGRGSGKSTFFAGLMIKEHLANPGFRSVCLREVQRTLRDSAKRLLEDQINLYDLQRSGFKIWKELLETPGDGVITFSGLSDLTADSIKSMEGVMVAWVEEAQTLTQRSYELLTPTIRAPGSSLWFSFNPRRKTDIISQRFQGTEVPTGSVIVRANWDSNPFFPPELEQERLDCLRLSPDSYEHVWNGDYVGISSSAYYKIQLIEAKAEGRLGRVSRDPLMTFRSFWDIGGTGAKADSCSIWIAQFIGKEIRILDYYEAVGQPLATHVNWLRENGYGKAQIVLPHDGINHDKVYSVTYESALSEAGFDVFVVQNQGAGAAKQRIEAARRLFPTMWFDKEKCNGGIEAISDYHPKIDEARGIDLGPDHSWSSHGCLVAGTLINTQRGEVPIEEVVIGDYVLTPEGYARVDNSGMTKISTELIEVTLSDGKRLVATPEHKIFTTTGLFLSDALGYNNSILTIEAIQCSRLVNASKMGYRDAFIENTKALNIGIGSIEKRIAHNVTTSIHSYIESLPIVRQARLKFIQLMETVKTSALIIGQQGQKAAVEMFPQNILCKNLTGLSFIGDLTTDITQEDILSLNLWPGMFGSFITTRFQKVMKYTIRTKTRKTTQSRIFNLSKMENTKNCMERQILGSEVKQIKNNSHQQENLPSYGMQVLKVLNGTDSMEKTALRSNTTQSAQFAESLIKPINQLDQLIAVGVVKIKRIKKRLPVYDLTVNKHHCYYANGILVSNSDAFGLMAVAHPLLMDNPEYHRPIDYSRHNLGIV
jgi:phage terminase large subunit